MLNSNRKGLLIIASMVSVVAMLVLLGWIANVPLLMTIFPGYISMKFNTGLAFFFTGIVLYLTITEKLTTFRYTLSTLIILFSAIILAQDITGKLFGIDELFMKDYLEDSLRHGLPGRMAPSTAFSFISLHVGLSLIKSSNRYIGFVSQTLFHLCTFISFVAILGYIFNTPILYKLSFLTSMAIHTALLHFLSSVTAALLRPHLGLMRIFTGKMLGDVLVKRIFPILVVLFILMAYLRILSYRYNLLSVESGIAVYTAIIIVSVLIVLYRNANWINMLDTKRLDAETELRNLNTHLEELVELRTLELNAIFDAAHVAIIAANKKGIISHFNKGAELMLGYKAEELIGKQTPLAFHLPAEIEERGAAMSKQFGSPVLGFDVFVQPIINNSYISTNWTYVRKDGTKFPVQLVVTAMKNSANKIDGFLGIATDVSELYNSKEDLGILTNQLQKKNAKLLNFAHIASHNLRSPAGNLKLLLQMYQSAETTEEKELLFTHIESVTNSLGETLNNLVDSLKYQEDTDIAVEKLVFQDMLDKIKKDLSAQLLETDAIIVADFSKASIIHYPKDYLESILLNLLTNAIKYRSPKRLPNINISTEDAESGIVMKFTDNGLGIDMQKHGDKLFGLNKTFHGNIGAKGVGLYIVKTQVEAMGGTITAQSKLDAGTTFIIQFNRK